VTDDGPVSDDGTTADWKLGVVVRDDLAPWQALNVTAFVVSGIGTVVPSLIGERYVDGSARTYLPMFVHPVRVFTGDAAALRRAFDRALARPLEVAVYTDALFTTGNDVDNRAQVAAVATGALSLAGFAVAGDRRQVDRALDRLALHP
jgi:hypothetical protein